ncbi:SWIM zinc finger family protein [Streptomyces violaceochromogenes]|uniref:SWIM zinc finger family protein n=1 Tax=Streptomyces violaceochromogenes TaxID=67377 RepID=A0ABU6M834_9ACTN|nr:SWIM zinc finger family protein [Streptomyces violaceochromogenes]MEC7057753.1 SWIM zinc finger family protein [Streptomyces violaceochromogenes]
MTEPGPEAQGGAESPGHRPGPADAPAETDAPGVAGSGPVARTGSPVLEGPGRAAGTGAPAEPGVPGVTGSGPVVPTGGPALWAPGSAADTGAPAEPGVSGLADAGRVAPTGGPAFRDPGPAPADAFAEPGVSGLADSGRAARTGGPALRAPAQGADISAPAEPGAPEVADAGRVAPTGGPAFRDPGPAPADAFAEPGVSGLADSGRAARTGGPALPDPAPAAGTGGPASPDPAPAAGTGGSASPDPVPAAGTGGSASPDPVPAAGTDAPAPSPTAPPPPAPGHVPPRRPEQPSSVNAGPVPVSAPPVTSAARSTPRAARSMAAPNRDHELRRTFPPFPPRDGDRFAESWWGNAWVGALEQGALDVKRLERGRGYAGQGHVDAITVTPGLVLAYVQGSRPRPYRVQVRLRTLDDTDWDRFLDAAADRPGHIAALLDKEMPQSLAECGVPLLPGPGDLEPRCSCPDRGHPCKHAAALCYQTARLLDADPFVLLLLRGRGERELLDALSRLSATRAARAARDKGPAPLPGVRAAEVLASSALAPLPAPLPPPAHPEQPPAYPAAPGGPDPFALDQLATDAAARAHALLGTGRDPVGQLTFWQDAVRLAAARPGAGLTAGTRSLYASLAAAAGRTPSELARAVAAWRQGGLEGLAVLEEPWDPPAGRFDRARPLLLAADLPAFRPWRNHLTHPRGHLQLRLGRDGLWYAYESEPGHDDWWPRGTPDPDPVGALTGLGVPGDF